MITAYFKQTETEPCRGGMMILRIDKTLVHFSLSVPALGALPQYSFTLFERPKRVEKAAGLVLAAGRSSARFTKPLKTHSSALLTVASSSSNTTRFATSDRGRRSARFERRRPLRRPGQNDGAAVIWLATRLGTPLYSQLLRENTII